jgi:peptidoglycan/xylan/chitin deacetylase (PgdA/CDA1 family)
VVLLNAVLHVDLDGTPEIFGAHGWPYARDDDPLFMSGLRNLLDLLDELRITATLFVIVRALEHPERLALVREAVRRGHAIASHTVSHRWLPGLSRDERRREIAESRSRLMDLLAVPVDGFRAPGFGVTDDMDDLLAESGYAWDSSRFPTGGPGPYRRGGILELPLPAYRPLPVPWHPSYSLVIGTWYFRLGLARHDGAAPLVVLLHLTDVSDPLPADYLSGWKQRIFTLSHRPAAAKRDACRAMLRATGERSGWTGTNELLQRTVTA